MANTRQSTKRARQSLKKKDQNQIVKTATRSAIKDALDSLNTPLSTKDASKVKEAYSAAVRALSKAASKGVIPKGRAARKIGRLTRMFNRGVKKTLTKTSTQNA
jgi:small subunit ribosomal protein S20